MEKFSLEIEPQVQSAIDSVEYHFEDGLIHNEESISLDSAKEYNPLLIFRWKLRECSVCALLLIFLPMASCLSAESVFDERNTQNVKLGFNKKGRSDMVLADVFKWKAKIPTVDSLFLCFFTIMNDAITAVCDSRSGRLNEQSSKAIIGQNQDISAVENDDGRTLKNCMAHSFNKAFRNELLRLTESSKIKSVFESVRAIPRMRVVSYGSLMLRMSLLHSKNQAIIFQPHGSIHKQEQEG